jgi:hypothetical protein
VQVAIAHAASIETSGSPVVGESQNRPSTIFSFDASAIAPGDDELARQAAAAADGPRPSRG